MKMHLKVQQNHKDTIKSNSIKVSLLNVCPQNRGAPQSPSVWFGKVMNFQEVFFFLMVESSYGMLEKTVSVTRSL